MSTQKFPWSQLMDESDESRFDVRLMEKKIDEKFLTADQAATFVKNIPAETEYEFTSAEALDAENPTEAEISY